MMAYYIIHKEPKVPGESVTHSQHFRLTKCEMHDNTKITVLSELFLGTHFNLCNLLLSGDFLRSQAARLEVSAAVCYVPLIQAAIDFLRFELITCFTRETGLRWNPLRSPLILRKLPHGLADGFTEMCFPIENNYTGDCGAGINLEHTVSILNISKQP